MHRCQNCRVLNRTLRRPRRELLERAYASAYGIGSSMFSGVMDNTDIFFKAMQAALGGTRIRPEALW